MAMKITILQMLCNAEVNLFESNDSAGMALGRKQMHDAIVLLNKGYGLGDDAIELLVPYAKVELVPERGRTLSERLRMAFMKRRER